ncbi:hypothetical protein K8Z61_18455 [Nocardioides sp. TRM66260-LWL]|uniref:hypothetical protein n=1 Tax=Nocardioides sp. TRM66260-LWL TaxID=2874478 RepID=UPI001CC3BD8E|nr:hypothetical protein [Nocardioides sp. TRM66260-LWL]MBZ5736477.1 hypothetical protein [Nocardioides sp. TRM66260-LWL]
MIRRPAPVFVFRFPAPTPWFYGCLPCHTAGGAFTACGAFTTWRAAYDAGHTHAQHCPNRIDQHVRHHAPRETA